MTRLPRLAILTVSFGHGDQIRELLDSLGPATYSGAVEVLILDQPRPKDGHDPLLPRLAQIYHRSWTGTGWSLRLIQGGENCGYGRGLNLLESLADRQWECLIILNPDTVLPEGALEKWVDAALHAPSEFNGPNAAGPGNAIGLLAPALLNLNGTRQKSTYRFQTWRTYWSDHSLFAGAAKEARKAAAPVNASQDTDDAPVDVDWAMGAAWLVPRQPWLAVNGFDSSYFLYAEDTDFCWRLRQRGYRVVHLPSVTVVHDQGSPAGEQRGAQMVLLFRGLRNFVRRNYPFSRRVPLYFSMLADMALRIGLFLPLSGFGLRRHSLSCVRLRAACVVFWQTLVGR